ncbi:hypothetical protein [Pedobacter panaciterrae]|jgi:hypothetical protein|uniref:Uncharacterized protein n=1 Tax=Pedobacter panaciterrae TaxID=363849 RepID=A0ABU8NKQ0_9SPHI|nr:hypothetical protein [uncultured Pedobacter sp.]
MEYNAGEIVELAIRRQEINITELSRRLHVNRRTLYNWFTKNDLHPDLILQIGRIINYDFHPHFESGFFGFEPEQELNAQVRNAEQMPADLAFYWMGKYINLLEEYKGLLRKESFKKSDTFTAVDQ